MTVGSLWASLIGDCPIDAVLAWPPDVFALVDRVLDASEAYRFIVSPPPGAQLSPLGAAASTAAREWWEWLDRYGDGAVLPDSVLDYWDCVRDAIDVAIDDLSAGSHWHVIEALLALHAIADEACAGLGASTAVAPAPGAAFRAAAREFFAEKGSLSRLSRGVVRVLPRCRTSIGGLSIRSLSRHVWVAGPQVGVEWHRMLSRPTDVSPPENHANVLLLPWPLRVRASDFRSVSYPLAQMDPTEFGFFVFEPRETLDLGRVEAVLRAALDEAHTVDIVVLPESAIEPAEIEPLEALLAEFGVWSLIAGVRERQTAGELGGNWVHVGVRQEMVWRHSTQHKHHRWRLDGRQVKQYHLGGALSPTMQWWEAVSIPPRSLHIIDEGAVTITSLVCEDLARLEPVADLVRSIGPSVVITLLLDGPQLSSRWTARYASILADDPGSAVCTLTSYGMVRRCRPPGCDPSSVVALWKDPSGELTEIELADGADAVLIATAITTGRCMTADGRKHPGTTNTLTLAAVRSVFAEGGRGELAPRRDVPSGDRGRGLPALEEHELSKASSWAEAVAEVAFSDPSAVHQLLCRATSTDWRVALDLPAPTPMFEQAIDALRRQLDGRPTLEHLFAAARRLHASRDPLEAVTGMLLGIALEQRLLAEVTAGRLPAESLARLTLCARA